MYPAVKEVEPKSDYSLILKFSNGDIRRFDMKPYLEMGVFRELKDMEIFNTVRVSFDSIEWDNEADFDPEVLFNYSSKI